MSLGTSQEYRHTLYKPRITANAVEAQGAIGGCSSAENAFIKNDGIDDTKHVESSSKDWGERDLTPSFLAVIGKVSLKALYRGRREMVEVLARVACPVLEKILLIAVCS